VTLAVGQTLGDYRIIGIIGSGGMGSVYKVQHLISDRVEAMKVVLPDLIDSADLADRFIREIKVQARLSHPNITSLHNAFRADGQLLMVMEYIEGTTLYARLRQGRMEPRLILEIMLQILSALGYAHAHGVVHRDIKPGNVMITSGGLVKIMDFGIARSLTDRQLTQAGAAIGSVYYMSPEQVQGTAVDARSDLYSVGILLYEVVTGTRPITGDSSWAVMNAHINQIPRSPGALNASLPNSLSVAILKALEKNPADRFQSASEFADALRAVERLYAASLQGPASIDTEQVSLFFQGRQFGTPSENRPKQEQSIRAAAPTEVKTPTPATPVTPGASSNLKRFDASELEQVKRELAVYLGPMARIMADRAAKKANNWQQLYEILAAELPEGEERKKFLARRRR
jgi:serine/threonine protein kinase